MSEDALESLRTEYLRPHPSSAPMMRWWWFGPAVERPELDRQLQAMATAGIGGVEVAFVYPLDTATTTFGSPSLLADLRWSAERARDLGLRFDVTMGSGWSFGGWHITAELAARGVHWDRREIGAGSGRLDVAAAWPGDELIAAYLGPGADAGAAHDLVQQETEPTATGWRITLDDTPGPRHVLLAWSRLTGQQVKRAAAGAEGPVLDHYSSEATIAHLRAVAEPILDAIPAELLGSLFCDSLEVYHSDWTGDLPQEFERRRGYPLLPELPLLREPGAQSHKLRADYHRTLTELYEQRFVATIQRWCSARGVPFRIQGYGTPPATMSSYRFADCFEGEGWGWTELTATRWASSAAHHYRRDVVSAEAWTWVNSPSLRATPLDLVGEAHEHLLNGVTLLIGHGWPYSPADAPGLGWLFYAAGCLDDRNPWWPAMPQLTQYLSRLCWLLQQGSGVADVAVYLPTDDLLAAAARGIGGSLDCFREANRAITSAVLGPIRRSGLDYHLIDDDAIAATEPQPPAIIVVPEITTMPAPTLHWLQAAAAGGSRVLTLGALAPGEGIDGAEQVDVADLDAALRQHGPTPLTSLDPGTSCEVGMVHRHLDDLDVRLLANTSPNPQRVAVQIAGPWQLWTPEGITVRSGTGPAPVTLEGYQAAILVSGTAVAAAATAMPDRHGDAVTAPLADWSVDFGDGPQPVRLPHRWEDDPNRAAYSGAATYTTTISINSPSTAVVDFGNGVAAAGSSPERGVVGPSFRAAMRAPVGEIAVVAVDDVECGIAWTTPYRVDLGQLDAGDHTLTVTVYNTAANALGHDHEIHHLVERTEAQFGRRFVMQELDRALETVNSGLLAPPVLEVAPA